MNTKLCPTCKTPIPAHAPGGFCPACILRDADELPPLGRTAPSLDEVRAAFPQLEVMELIGQGGMGFVYKARQPSLDRTVALKILSPELGRDPAFAERFAREARVLGKLNHPNIVTVFEHGESGGFFYLIMEHVDGVNLRQAMRAGRFTPAQALAVVPGICDALQAAHAQGVWHRDIKPENILLDAQGGVKIVDFGIARIVGDPQRDFTLTMTGAALGSAAYMAPEQHEKPHDVDHRADIYSLGVVIYEMLTGELPLGRFPAPSERAAVSARIDEIVFQTLEKERNLRQQSAEEVKTDVHRAAKHADAAPENRGVLPAKVTLWALGLILAGLLFGGAGAAIFLIGETMRDAHSWLVAGVSIFAIGAIAFVLGFAGACYALWQMHRGLIPPVWRPLLRVLTVVPWLLEIAERCWSNADDVSSTSRAVVIAILTGGVATGVAGVFDEFKPIWSEKGHFFITGLIALTVIVGIGRLGWSQLLRHDGIGTERTAFWAGFAALVFTIVGAIEAKRFDGQWPTSYALAKAEIRLTEDSSLTDARLQQAYEIAAGPYTNKHRMEHVGQTIHLSVVGLGYLSGDNVPAATLLNSLIRRFFETLDDTERTSIKSIETFGGDRYLPRNTRQAVYIVLLSGIGLAGVIIVTVGRRGLWVRFAMCASVLAIGFVLPVWRSSAISPFTPDPSVGPELADIPIAQRTADFSTPVGAARALCDAAQARNVAGVLAAIIPAEREADEDPDDYARVIMATYGHGRAAFSKPRPDLGTQVIVPTKFFVFQSFGTNHPAGGDLRASANENRIVCVQTPEGWRVKTSVPPKNRRKVAAKNAGPSKAADQAEEIRSQQPKTAEELVERLKTGAKERPIGFSARASGDAPVSTMEPLAPSLPPGPAISAEDVLRKMNAAANESNGEEFKKHLRSSSREGGPLAPAMEPFYGRPILVKTLKSVMSGLGPQAEVFAAFKRPDNSELSHNFYFVLEDRAWRFKEVTLPLYRAKAHIEFQSKGADALAILQLHVSKDNILPLEGKPSEFYIVGFDSYPDKAAKSATQLTAQLQQSLSTAGLAESFKVLKAAEKPQMPMELEPVRLPIVFSPEDVLRKLNALANQSNGAEFMKLNVRSRQTSNNPAARWMEPLYGTPELVKVIEAKAATKSLIFSSPAKTVLLAGLKKKDGSTKYLTLTFALEDNAWRLDDDGYPTYRAVTRFEFRAEKGDALAILRTHIDRNAKVEPVPGVPGQFDIFTESNTAAYAANLSRNRTNDLKASLKKAGLDAGFKVIKEAEVPTKPIQAEDAEIEASKGPAKTSASADSAKPVPAGNVPIETKPMLIHFLPGNRIEVDGKAATPDELIARLKQPNDGKPKWRLEVKTEAGIEGRFIADVLQKMKSVGAKFDEDVMAKLRDSMKDEGPVLEAGDKISAPESK